MALFLVPRYLERGEFHCIWNGRWNLISDVIWNWKLITHNHKQSKLWKCIKHYSSPFNLPMWDNFFLTQLYIGGELKLQDGGCKIAKSTDVSIRHEASLEKELTPPARGAVDQHFKFGTQGEMWNWMLWQKIMHGTHYQYSYTIYEHPSEIILPSL